MNTTTQQTPAVYAISNQSKNTINHSTSYPKATPNIPTRPTSLPYPPTNKNIPKFKENFKIQFASSALNCGPPFPQINTQLAYIHLKSNAAPLQKSKLKHGLL